jgi:hypothetical protein
MQALPEGGQVMRSKTNGKPAKFNHGAIPGEVIEKPIDSIKPSPENELLYRPVTTSDPEVIALAESIHERVRLAKPGILEPLVITLDGYIISGHRRHMAAKLAGLKTVPCRVENIHRADPGFLELLRDFNRQRIKTLAEITREEVISADPDEAYRILVAHRREQSSINAPDEIEIEGHKHRAEISEAKRPFLDAIRAILEERRAYWPLSVRQVHYALLNKPPLIHARKPVRQHDEGVQGRHRPDSPRSAHRLDFVVRH